MPGVSPTAVAPDRGKSITMTCGWQSITSPRSAATHRRCAVCAGHRMEDTSPAEATTTWCAFGHVCRRAAWATTTSPFAAGVNIKALSRLRLFLLDLVWRIGLFNVLGGQMNFLSENPLQALAWCSWQPNILASGGGTSDRRIRIWNVNSGSCISSIDTQSQVATHFSYCIVLFNWAD